MLTSLGASAQRKLELMFEGIRYTDALGAAAQHSFPNFYPYRFNADEDNPTGNPTVAIPYLLRSPDGSMVRVKGAGDSSWHIGGNRESGYLLNRDGEAALDVDFEPLPAWMTAETSDGFSMARTGLSLHGDMGVINVAPGCEYFLEKVDKVSMRCTFCAYGAPDKRTQDLGQEAGVTSLPVSTYTRIQETLEAALVESDLRHLYLVGGSMTDWHQEGKRFIEIAEQVQQVNQRNIPVTCGSGALPRSIQDELRARDLVQAACFNLEIWSKPLFERICPGKNRFVGYENWIESLEYAVSLWGKKRVYTAMVAGIELEPEHELTWEQAADIALEGAEDLCARGIIPVYSLHWPVGGRDHPEYMNRLKGYFEKLSLGYRNIREKYDLDIWDGFMCRKCAYMQLECDIDHECQHGSAS